MCISGSLRAVLASYITQVEVVELLQESSILERRYEETGPGDFEFLEILGQGVCGQVCQVRKKSGKDKGKRFAMKVLMKGKDCETEDLLLCMKNEINILQKLKHPYIVDFYSAFETPFQLCMTIEFVLGGDFLTILGHETKLSEFDASLYLGEIILAVEHIHKEGIIHRDLKPTNILFDAEGHLRLTDFGDSKQINDGDRTFTICGTSVYMAPEILLEIGYDKSVDWWSVGAIMYQMLTGEIPYFALDCGERQNNIYLHKIVYPDYVSTEAENLMRGLMRTYNRLGSGPDGAEAIKMHPFFEEINWDDMMAKKVLMPFCPDWTVEDDASLFEPIYTGEPSNNYIDNSGLGDKSDPFHVGIEYFFLD
ncbi:ribosomal protein S6 kinase beta-2 [Nephila pilipes]|uniref:Ribosomal protein S6 kinase beta-2 n=1 Tax=Nephila pilipes TaxID=299642 RepID=A0A8X6QF18_NEPPI|nr:ribosomal protein S6 kinase beta-2 [Nephila pilipes]